MNQPHSKTIRYTVAGICVFLMMLLLGWFVLREPPAQPDDQPAETAAAPPRVRHVAPRFAPEDDADRETMTNQIAGSTTTNAAVLYRQAFALYDALSEEQKKLVSNWRTNVDVMVEAELCEEIQPICDLMHQAAMLTNCDWELEQPITFETRLPHLSSCRSIARATVWSAAHCRTGNPAGAVDDIVAGSRLGRNLSPPLIGHLVDIAIQNLVIEAVAEQASILAGTGDSRLSQLFGDSRYEETLSHAIEQNADMINREADKLATLPREESLRQLKQAVEDNSELQSMDLTQALAAWRQVGDLQRDYARMVGSSDAEYREWMTRLEDIRKTNPFAEVFLSALDRTTEKTRAFMVRSAMAAAGLAVMQDGPDALQSHPDPATGQPFTYSKTSDGFELQSGYQFNGEPVRLRFK